MQIKPVERKVANLIADDLSTMGYDLVRVQMSGGGRYATLQIMAERLDGAGMTVEDCAAISHSASEKLDADEALADQYTLEVSSPGIDRPLVRVKDFERYAGHVAKIELETPLEGVADGKRRFQGDIVRVTGDALETASIEFRTEKGAFSIPMKEIARAKLVMTDALLDAAAKHQSNETL